MGVVLNWSSGFPATVDTVATNFPVLSDGVHDVLASHVNELASAVVEIQNAIGGIRTVNFADPLSPSDGDILIYDAATSSFVAGGSLRAVGYNLTMSTYVDCTIATTELVVGGGVFHGGAVGTLQPKLRFIGTNNATGSPGDAQLRLYDLGPSAGPPVAGVLRATATISSSLVGQPRKVDVNLTPDAAPSSSGEIYNTSRLYEIRLFLSGSGGSIQLNWAGIVLEP